MALDRPHLLIPDTGRRLAFVAKGGGGSSVRFPAVADRRANAARILSQVEAVIHVAADDPISRLSGLAPMTVRAGKGHGVNDSVPGPRKNEILSAFGHDKAQRVNIALDPVTLENFETAAERYVGYRPQDPRRPNHFHFFEAQPEIVGTTVADLWASSASLPSPEAEFGWEVWVQPVAEPRFREALEVLGLPNPPRGLEFAGVRVIGLTATRHNLEQLTRSASIAQLRPASSLNSPILEMSTTLQQIALQGSVRRLQPAEASAPAVCLLDTGVNRQHPLLADSVDFAGVVGGSYSPDDYNGHGTNMAGVALFRDLPGLINGGAETLSIRLESVVVEPPPGVGPAHSIAAVRLREAVDLVEAQAGRARTFCLAMNAVDEADDGSPSSLSSELDVLAAEVAGPRLFCVAAGNLEDAPPALGDYQALNEVSGIRSPAQAWNALTVGACTDLDSVPPTHSPVAPLGDLSPWSRTSVNWERRNKPPSKPDIVFEGGNQMMDVVSGDIAWHRDLCLLTTSHDLAAPLALTAQTSPATAAVAGLCARVQAEYPRFWPETVRGLLAHSAEYTSSMLRRAQQGVGTRTLQAALLERFGLGRPDPARVMHNAEDALTLIVQGRVVPLRLNDNQTDAVLGYMRFHALPWPIEVLEALGSVEAELRVTLSYFVEPNPGAAIRGDMDLYPSHGLDFDVMRPDESEEQAIGRLNAAHPAPRASTAPTLDWTYGKYRGRGSLRHDRLTTTAANLARMGGVTVFPRKGWWGKDHLDQQVRYALIVSIRTPEQDIYTEIASSIAIAT